MVAALGREIAESLARLAESGEESAIDLRSLPLGPEDHAALDALLGEGEVRATVEAGGATDIVETRFPGVWRATHRDPQGALRHAEILIAAVPALLRADPRDMTAGAGRLAAALDPSAPEGDAE
jgi:hydrogenase-1 operon protein HyaF